MINYLKYLKTLLMSMTCAQKTVQNSINIFFIKYIIRNIVTFQIPFGKVYKFICTSKLKGDVYG